jgi:hypothetical protein
VNIYGRRQDSSIGFGAPVRANMRTGGVTSTAVTSSLLETVSENWSSISNSFYGSPFVFLCNYQCLSLLLTAFR